MGERKSKKSKLKASGSGKRDSQMNDLTAYTEIHQLKILIEKITENENKLKDRLEDAEIQINLITRLLTTLCIERLGMRVGVLKRLLKRIEKEAIRDSQILHLESLFNLSDEPQDAGKDDTLPKKPSKEDPWEDIS